jgi:hypothetical protein
MLDHLPPDTCSPRTESSWGQLPRSALWFDTWDPQPLRLGCPVDQINQYIENASVHHPHKHTVLPLAISSKEGNVP